MARSTGKVRAARLTDLAALGELSRLAQADGEGTRSLGLPVSGPPIGVFSLFRLPLGAFQPHDVLYVFERDGHDRGPAARRARERPRRVDGRGARRRRRPRRRATSGSGSSSTCCATAAKRGASRFHVACADADDNVELFMQAGFMRYGDEHVLYREPVGRACRRR